MNAFIMQKMIMKLSLLDFQENTYLSFHQMEITIRFLMMKKNKPALRDFLWTKQKSVLTLIDATLRWLIDGNFTMKKAFAALFVLLSLVASTQAFAGRCQHDSDTSADGSRCGGRSADSRPGGGGIR